MLLALPLVAACSGDTQETTSSGDDARLQEILRKVAEGSEGNDIASDIEIQIINLKIKLAQIEERLDALEGQTGASTSYDWDDLERRVRGLEEEVGMPSWSYGNFRDRISNLEQSVREIKSELGFISYW